MNLAIVLKNNQKMEAVMAAYGQALALCEELHADFPADDIDRNYLAGNYPSLAVLLAASGRPEEIEKLFRTLLDLNPKSPHTYNKLAWILANSQEPKFRDPCRAVELAKKSVALAPTEGTFWNTLGVAHYRAGAWNSARVALTRSMQLGKGGDSFDWFFLAMAFWQSGDKQQARAWRDRAVQWMEKNKPQDEELRRFRTEAVELLGTDTKKD